MLINLFGTVLVARGRFITTVVNPKRVLRDPLPRLDRVVTKQAWFAGSESG
jgi:hypothetical protein